MFMYEDSEEEDSELIHLQWQLRPEPRETETEEIHGAEDDELSKNFTERSGLGGRERVTEAS